MEAERDCGGIVVRLGSCFAGQCMGMSFSAKTGLTLSSFLECADLFICSKLAEWMPGQDLVSLLVA